MLDLLKEQKTITRLTNQFGEKNDTVGVPDNIYQWFLSLDFCGCKCSTLTLVVFSGSVYLFADSKLQSGMSKLIKQNESMFSCVPYKMALGEAMGPTAGDEFGVFFPYPMSQAKIYSFLLLIKAGLDYLKLVKDLTQDASENSRNVENEN